MAKKSGKPLEPGPSTESPASPPSSSIAGGTSVAPSGSAKGFHPTGASRERMMREGATEPDPSIGETRRKV